MINDKEIIDRGHYIACQIDEKCGIDIYKNGEITISEWSGCGQISLTEQDIADILAAVKVYREEQK